MAALHIVQGGVANGDKAWLEKAARQGLRSRSWIAPKSVQIGDEVVIYVAGYGFFATGRIASLLQSVGAIGSADMVLLLTELS